MMKVTAAHMLHFVEQLLTSSNPSRASTCTLVDLTLLSHQAFISRETVPSVAGNMRLTGRRPPTSRSAS